MLPDPRSGALMLWAGLTCLTVGHLAWADEPFDYFANSFSVIGLKDYRHGTRVTPDNQLQLAGKQAVRLRFGRQLTPLSRKQTKTLMDGWMPVVLLTADDGPVRYEFTLWATPLPTVKDWRKAFDWPTEGENFLNWITVKATNTGDARAEAKAKVEQTGPAASGAHAFAWSLAPGQSAEGVARIPFSPIKDASGFAQEDPTLWLKRTVDYWRAVMAGAARIEVPCRKATEALRAAHVCQMLVSDHGELHAGEGFYDEFYIRDGAYQVMELEEAGLTDMARKALEFYLSHQRPDGRFETQKNQFDANGQAVWALWQFYRITGDRKWLERVYPQMRRAADWTMKARREAPADSPFAGLLPAAPADGEYLWDGKHHIVGYELWNLRGLLCTAGAAQALGKADEAQELLREAELYRAAVDAAWKRTGLAHFPPSWERAGTHWGNTETLWPTELFARDDPRVTALINEVRENHGGGYVEGTIRWLGTKDAIHPYMGAYTTMADLVRGEHEQVVEDFYWYLLHSTATHAFAEGIYYKRRAAWNDTIPHPLGASNYALMLRHMLLHEQPDELHLLRAVPDWWLAEGKQIRIERAPTHFGLVGLRVRGTTEGVELQFDPPKRRPPKRIVLHLPKSRPLLGWMAGVEVAVRADQKRRWDFPTVVKQYTEQAGPRGADQVKRLIRQAGNADDDGLRLEILKRLQKMPGLDAGLKADLTRMVAAVERWIGSKHLPYFGAEVSRTMDFDFRVANDSPLYPLCCLYRGRMLTWVTLESGGIIHDDRRRRQFLDKAVENFELARAAFPENRIVGMYLGEPIPWRRQYPAVEGAPEWAALQRENLERLAEIIHWWIDHRMQPDGQYGGGWGDDCEMWRWWVPVLIAFDDPRITAAQARFSDALMGQPHMKAGYTSRMSDVEHTAEDSADVITPMMHLDPDNPLWKNRALRLSELMERSWTGRNRRGGLQFKSTYFTAERIDDSPQRACDTVYHPRAVQPALLYWQRTGDQGLGALFTAWMDTWVEATARAERGKPAGIIPSAIHWPVGRIGGLGKDWWDPRNHGETTLYEWPSAASMMCNTLLLCWKMTGDEKYLGPLRSMAAIRLKWLKAPPERPPAPGSAGWCATKLGFLSPTLAKYKLLSGSSEFDSLLARDHRAFLVSGPGGDRTALVAALRDSAEALRVNFAGYTSEVRYTDRVLRFPAVFGRDMMFAEAVASIRTPNPALVYSSATGDPGDCGYFPLNAVRWLTPPRDIAALVTATGSDRFTAELFHFGEDERPMSAELYLLAPGRYTFELLPEGAGSAGEPRSFSVVGPRARISFELPARRACVVRVLPEKSAGPSAPTP